MRERTESKRRCSVYPIPFPTPSNFSLQGRSWMKISFSLSLFFPLPPFPVAVLLSSLADCSSEVCYFSHIFSSPTWNFTLTGEQIGGWGSLDRKWLNLPQCVSEPFLLQLKLVMTDLRQKGQKKNENVYSLISSGPTFCLSPWFRKNTFLHQWS